MSWSAESRLNSYRSRRSSYGVPQPRYTYYSRPTYNPQGMPGGEQAPYYGAQVRNAAHWQPEVSTITEVPTPTEGPTAAQVLESTAAQVLTAAQVPTATQVPTAAQKDLDNDSEMWNMYFDEVKEEDNRITDAWKEDASSVVVFTGLFSAIVGGFIIEFYKKLSTDSGNQTVTVALLQQISQQLPNSPNRANSNTANQLSPPGTAMVWVNILWLTSLVLSLTCALIATLLQQWARRYIETPKSTDVLRHRARVRSLLLVGARLYKIRHIAEILPTLLHLSVFLFFGGLIITFHTIHKTVAISVDVAVGLSGLAYITISILPCLDVKCPYRTPISQILWYPCRAFIFFASLCRRSCLQILQGFPPHLALSRGFAASDHRGYFTDGLEKSIVNRAVEMLKDGDRRRVTWLFNQLALGDRSKFLKFAASIPRHRIPDLILPTELNSLPLVSLLVLLRSCVAATHSRADEDIRKQSLLVCLLAIHHIAKAPILPDLDFMQAHLANTDHIKELSLWNYDSLIHITSRAICALVARKVVRKSRLGEADLRWLQEVIEEPPNAILEASITVRDQMNFKAFVTGVLPDQPNDLSTEDAAIFNETLMILLNERINDQNYSAADFQNLLSEEVERIHRYDSEVGRQVFDRLHGVFPSLIAPSLGSAEARYPTSLPVAFYPPVVTAGGDYTPSTPSPVTGDNYFVVPTPPPLPATAGTYYVPSTLPPPHPITASDYYMPSTLSPPHPVTAGDYYVSPPQAPPHPVTAGDYYVSPPQAPPHPVTAGDYYVSPPQAPPHPVTAGDYYVSPPQAPPHPVTAGDYYVPLSQAPTPPAVPSILPLYNLPPTFHLPAHPPPPPPRPAVPPRPATPVPSAAPPPTLSSAPPFVNPPIPPSAPPSVPPPITVEAPSRASRTPSSCSHSSAPPSPSSTPRSGCHPM